MRIPDWATQEDVAKMLQYHDLDDEDDFNWISNNDWDRLWWNYFAFGRGK